MKKTGETVFSDVKLTKITEIQEKMLKVKWTV